MDKRSFLKFTGLGLGGAAVAAASFGILAPSFESAMASLIRNELNYLKLDDKGLAQFVKDYSRYTSQTSRLVLKGFAFANLDSSDSGRIHHLISSYLLGSDFFINKMDENRTVQYLGINNPHASPCSNPFSQAYYPQDLA